jgi:iron complex outermembrane receptor protein
MTRTSLPARIDRIGALAPLGALALFVSPMSMAADEPDSIIGRVIVTAERRPENIQTVPISVSVLSADQVRSLNLRETLELSTAVPGLNFTQQGIGATPFIRGVGAMSGAIGNEAPVSVYIDGVYIAAPTAAVFSLQDVQQIEVLKGPQGTLFGRNATGGVIQVARREPTADPAAELRLQLSSYSTTEASLYATTGLSDAAAANVTLHHREQRSGWGTNLATGESTFRHEELGASTKIMWAPGPATRLVFSGSYFDRDGEDGIGYHIIPGSLGADGRTGYQGFYNSSGDPQDRGAYRHAIVSARIEQDLPAFRLINTVSWQELDAFFRLDQDETPLRIVDAPISQYGRTVTEELQALSLDGAAWPWIVGLYYLRDLSAYDPLTLRGAAVVPLSSSEIHSQQQSRSYAIYAQTTAPLTSRTQLTLGARYTRDERTVDGSTLGTLDTEQITLAAARQKAQWEKPTWRVALSHDLSDDLMAYVAWDRGFKSGVFNLLSYAAPAVFPEVLDAYQGGLKSEWLQHRLRLNIAGFLYRYQNIQVESMIAGATIAVNAAAARMKGVEVDLEFLPTRRFTIGAGLALLDGHYSDFPNAPFNVPNRDAAGNPTGGNTIVSADAAGNRTIRSPRTTASVHGGIRIPVSVGELDFNIGYAYSTRFAWDPDNRLQQRAFDTLNAALEWSSPSGALSVRAAGSNLTNSRVHVFALASALGDFGTPRAPRILSLEVSTKF